MFSRGRSLLRQSRWVSKGTAAAKTTNFFHIFPKTFPLGGPPNDLFLVNLRSLRNEFRKLQSKNHPDIIAGSDSSPENESDITSCRINRAYVVVRNPYLRAAHMIELLHPEHFDITKDETSKQLIQNLKSEAAANLLNYEQLLMTVLEAHESMEMAVKESDLNVLQDENDRRIEISEHKIADLLNLPEIQWNKVIIEAIRLKYWANIDNGIKEWEHGKPVLLTH